MKIYLKTNEPIYETNDIFLFGSYPNYIIIADEKSAKKFMKEHFESIKKFYFDYDSKNSKYKLLSLDNTQARIEPGAIIREGVTLDDEAIVLMGAIINVGAKIGSRTMIDMNATIGSNAIIGCDCHIGAGAVISGTLEPYSEKPVIIENEVFIGANAVILEGVHIYKGATIGASAVVTHDVMENTTVVGIPARPLDHHKRLELNEELRK